MEQDFFMNDRFIVLKILYENQVTIGENQFTPVTQEEFNRLNPELNVKSENVGELEDLSQVHIQNFSEVSNFMNDYFVS